MKLVLCKGIKKILSALFAISKPTGYSRKLKSRLKRSRIAGIRLRKSIKSEPRSLRKTITNEIFNNPQLN